MLHRIATAASAAAMTLAPISVLGQSSPNFSYGQVPTAGQWNAAFASKQDRLTFSPINKAGDTMSGRLVTSPSTINSAGLSVAPGIAPLAPGNGDIWATSAGLFARVANVTIQLADQASVTAETNRAQAAEATKAPINSPTFINSATTPKLTITGSGSAGPGDGFTSQPTGATVARSIAARALDMGRNVRDFGAVCDGATDNGPAFRAAFAAATVVRYDLEGCASNYLINTSVTIGAGDALVGPAPGFTVALGIRTTAAVDTFVAGGPQWSISDVRIQHDGSAGSPVNGGAQSYGKLLRSAITGSNAAATTALFYTSGSLITAEQNTFTNNRTNAFSVLIDSPSTSAPIVLRLTNNDFGGSGKGILISNSGGTNRPEGVYATNNHCFATNTCLQIGSVNDFRSVGNTWDIGGASQVVLAASGQGIDLASFDGDYFSTLDTTTTPPSTRSAATCMLISGPVARLTVRSKFAYCGNGISSTDGNALNFVIGSSFLNVPGIALNLQNVKGATLTGNTCTSCAYNFIIADGISGGPFILNENQWDPTGLSVLTQTTPANFRFGSGNTGINLAGYSAATTASMATGSTCVSLTIPHGLKGTPNLDKTTLSPRVLSGTMTNASATATAADATNITAQVCATVTVAGTVRVTANASL